MSLLKKHVLFFIAAFAMAGISIYPAAAQPAASAETPVVSAPLSAPQPPTSYIVINIPAHHLTLHEADGNADVYPVCVGKPQTQTPVGQFKIIEKEVNPEWINPKDVKQIIESGPDNPLGYRWIGIGNGYGIHSTNHPSSIGTDSSNGCIRLYEKDVEYVFDHVQVGTPVSITYQRAEVFMNADGKVYCTIWPDNYDRQSLSIKDIKEQLSAYHMEDFLSDAAMRDAISVSSGIPVYVADQVSVKIHENGPSLTGIRAGNSVYVPVSDLVEKYPGEFSYDKNLQRVTTQGVSIRAFKISDAVYFDVMQLQRLNKPHAIFL